MAEFKIEIDNITLPLNKALSKIRISDKDGNHKRKIIDCVISKDLFIEWMITNTQIEELIKKFLDENDIDYLIKEIKQIDNFIRSSGNSARQATKGKYIRSLYDFKEYEFTEKYNSYERVNSNGTINKIVFKMGDYTIAPHFYILIPFDFKKLILQNKISQCLQINDIMGNGACGKWQIEKSDIINMIKTISATSIDHKSDMISLLQQHQLTF